MKRTRRIVIAAVSVGLGVAGTLPAFASGSHRGSLVSASVVNNGELVSVDQPNILNDSLNGGILTDILNGNNITTGDVASGNLSNILSGNTLTDVASHTLQSGLDDITVKNFLNGFEVEHIADKTLQSGLDDGVVQNILSDFGGVQVGEGVSVDSVNTAVDTVVKAIVKNIALKDLLDAKTVANVLAGRL